VTGEELIGIGDGRWRSVTGRGQIDLKVGDGEELIGIGDGIGTDRERDRSGSAMGKGQINLQIGDRRGTDQDR